MKKFYFRVVDTTKSFCYSIDFSDTHLKPGECGKGQYVCLVAEDEEDMNNKLKNLDFSTITMVNDPTGE